MRVVVYLFVIACEDVFSSGLIGADIIATRGMEFILDVSVFDSKRGYEPRRKSTYPAFK